MSNNKFRATVAALACAPLIAVGTGVAAAAPAAEPAPVAPVQGVEVEPAVLSPFLTIPGAVNTCQIVLFTIPILFPLCVV
ncbi:hypothetical protein [Nocardia huaxiensis]|uniref:Uncharacterized protein n=1 Tax=Nocardia huaxiensis TaxID=2755382 RepID=A0A7D6VET0_9NOCA|nr:hypothetical protein [Nocardia huaxiensis]QLY33711.1 hypothetical protein H0264_17060 [Nocardia huaxiensis]UFS99366.1 hypothetical protein LPY97_16460 [Nocardia huaxiensis]